MESRAAIAARSAKEEIFAFPIDWEIVAQHSIVEKKLRPWVKKKVVEYLGAEEEAMIEFIIRAHRLPQFVGHFAIVIGAFHCVRICA